MKVRRFASLLLVLMLLASLTACGAAPMEKNEALYAPGAAADSYYGEMDAPMETMAAGLNKTETGSTTQLPANRKLIRTIRIDAETEDLTALQEDLAQRINQLGGYVEAKELYNGSNYAGYIRRNLSMTVRIPTEKADEFVNNVSERLKICLYQRNTKNTSKKFKKHLYSFKDLLYNHSVSKSLRGENNGKNSNQNCKRSI